METMIVRTLDEAATVVKRAEVASVIDAASEQLGATNSAYPNRTYEDGIVAFFNWLIGNDDRHPYPVVAAYHPDEAGAFEIDDDEEDDVASALVI